MTILCLQAGEANTGEFDPFDELIPLAKAAGAWVHVDAAFGLWARASSRGVDERNRRRRADTVAIREAVQTSGEAWFGGTVWQGRPAFRISVSSRRTSEQDADALVQLLTDIRKRV